MQTNTNPRLGVFRITSEFKTLLAASPQLCRSVFEGARSITVPSIGEDGVTTYVLNSDKFDPITDGEGIPQYRAEVMRDGGCITVAWSRCRSGDNSYSEAAISLFQDLLAVIHRDGGRCITEHGIRQAASDAKTIIYAMRAREDELLAHCDKEGGECSKCAEIVCPQKCGMHFHHDGCPVC